MFIFFSWMKDLCECGYVKFYGFLKCSVLSCTQPCGAFSSPIFRLPASGGGRRVLLFLWRISCAPGQGHLAVSFGRQDEPTVSIRRTSIGKLFRSLCVPAWLVLAATHRDLFYILMVNGGALFIDSPVVAQDRAPCSSVKSCTPYTCPVLISARLATVRCMATNMSAPWH